MSAEGPLDPELIEESTEVPEDSEGSEGAAGP